MSYVIKKNRNSDGEKRINVVMQCCSTSLFNDIEKITRVVLKQLYRWHATEYFYSLSSIPPYWTWTLAFHRIPYWTLWEYYSRDNKIYCLLLSTTQSLGVGAPHSPL